MASKWQVAPETDRLTLEILGEPCWLEVKRELTVGEARRVRTAGFGGMSRIEEAAPDGPDEAGKRTEVAIDWKGQSFARTYAYLVDWSLTDDKGNKLPVAGEAGRAAIEALREDVYEAIEAAINEHIQARDRTKKAQGGSPSPATTSP